MVYGSLMDLPKLPVLGIPMACVNYRQACEWLQVRAQISQVTLVAASATHLVVESHLDTDFFKVLSSFDAVFPDGMPNVWRLNLQGAMLRDRVYGPYLMRELIQKTPRPFKHYLFGGSERCLHELKEKLLKIQPDLDIVGAFSPPFRSWTEEDEVGFARQIQETKADFIWVALGGVKQEKWMFQNRARHAKGVFIAVGDAFELLAGRRTFAPLWMQRLGLTWVYRLIQEPRRLWKRYLVYNTYYLYFIFKEFLKQK